MVSVAGAKLSGRSRNRRTFVQSGSKASHAQHCCPGSCPSNPPTRTYQPPTGRAAAIAQWSRAVWPSRLTGQSAGKIRPPPETVPKPQRPTIRHKRETADLHPWNQGTHRGNEQTAARFALPTAVLPTASPTPLITTNSYPPGADPRGRKAGKRRGEERDKHEAQHSHGHLISADPTGSIGQAPWRHSRRHGDAAEPRDRAPASA